MIYLKLKQKPKNLPELLTQFFEQVCKDGEFKGVRTYADEECTVLQCVEGTYRSIDDIVETCKTYFPKVKDIEVFKTLYNLTFKDKKGQIYGLYRMSCSDIQKPTVCFSKAIGGRYDCMNYHGASNYSWDNIEDDLGFSSEEEIKNHFQNLAFKA